jgi:hypothetical protein
MTPIPGYAIPYSIKGSRLGIPVDDSIDFPSAIDCRKAQPYGWVLGFYPSFAKYILHKNQYMIQCAQQIKSALP